MRLRNYFGLPRGINGSGALGPVEMDQRLVTTGSEPASKRPWYCRHTGSDYWPRPCNECIARSEAGQPRKVQP